MLQMLFRLYPIICLARNSGGADCPCPVLLCFFINHEHCFKGCRGKENRRRSDIRWRHIQKKKSLSVYDTVSVSDFCWNHFIKLCRKCIWMDFHVNAFAIGRNLFFQHSIMLFHVSTEDGIFIAQFLKGFDRFFRSEIITADDIERSFLIRESS